MSFIYGRTWRRAPARLTHADVAVQYSYIMHTYVGGGPDGSSPGAFPRYPADWAKITISRSTSKTWRDRGITCTIPAHLHSARRRGKLSMISMEETSSPKVRSI